ncbi:MAG: hypothetical protein ABWZ76_01405 [Acidimicrobiales bacterium]
MTRTLLLALHITGVAAWLGANFVQLVLTPRIARGPADVAAAWTRQTIWLGERFYNVAGAVIGITGVLLVLDGDWSWGSGFIWVGIAVLVVGGVLGGIFFGPQAKQRAAALESGDHAGAAAVLGRIIPLGVLDTILVLTAILAMVDKWQA